MLALKLALGLKSNSAWTPASESSVEAWWENKTNITLFTTVGYTDRIYAWISTSKPHILLPLDETESPKYDAATGALTFDPSESAHLTIASFDLSLAGDFTIGIRCNINNTGGIIVGSNTETGEFFKIFSSTKLRVKVDNAAAVDLELDSGVWGDGYMVVTRESNVLKLWWNGVEQTTATPTLSGTADIDTLGVRKTDANPYDGSISEVQIFSSTSAALTAQVNSRLAGI